MAETSDGSTNGGKKRFNLEVSRAVERRLEEIREATDAASVSEVIRRALAVYDKLVEAQGEKARVVLKYPDGSEREVLVL